MMNDESTFHSNEDQGWVWAEQWSQQIKPKGQGRGIMVSDFIDEYNGYLQLTDEEWTGKANEGFAKPFILREGLSPVPAKLVTHILRVNFIDMVVLQWDNLEAQRNGTLQDAASSIGGSRSRREVLDLLS